MKTALQLLTGAQAELATRIVEPDPNRKTEVVDLTRGDVNYREVLEKIFKADSIQVW